MNLLEISRVTTTDGTAVLSLHGDLDMESSRRVEQELRSVERFAPRLIVLDLRELSFIDSSGLRLLVSADERARAAGRRLAVVAAPGPVHRVFKVTSLESRLSFVEPETLGI